MRESTDPLIPESDVAPMADALRSLAPASTGINRDRLLFEAGRAAAAPSLAWLWPASTIAFAGISAVLGAMMVFAEPPGPTVVERERIVEVRVPVPAEAPPPEVPSISPMPKIEFTSVELSPSPETVRMLQVRRDVLRWGPEMLPASKPGMSGMSAGEAARDLDRWLGVPSGTFSAPPPKPSAFANLFGEY